MSKTAITIDFDPDRLPTYDDKFLATLWHVCQANPADGFADEEPGELAMKVGVGNHPALAARRRSGDVPPPGPALLVGATPAVRAVPAGRGSRDGSAGRPRAVVPRRNLASAPTGGRKALPAGEAVVQAALEWQATRAPGADFMAHSRAETALVAAVAALRDAGREGGQ